MPDNHPCYSQSAHYRYGRLHLPVAPRCNIQCNYCNRTYDCPNENRPGVTSQLLSPGEARAWAEKQLTIHPEVRIVGIAGPGDPLADPDRTFQTLTKIKQTIPAVEICMATNGLMILDNMERINSVGLRFVTVTVNAVMTNIAQRIYRWVRFNGKSYRGAEAATILLKQQREGIKLLVKEGVFVKINTVFLPGINETHIEEIAEVVSDWGAIRLNILPHIPIPGTPFAQLGSPHRDALLRARLASWNCLPVIGHCRQCRADAVGYLGDGHDGRITNIPTVDVGGQPRKQPLNLNHRNINFLPKINSEKSFHLGTSDIAWEQVGVATTGRGSIDLTFSETDAFYIYRTMRPHGWLCDVREVNDFQDRPNRTRSNMPKMDLLRDCDAVLATGFTADEALILRKEGIEPVVAHGSIEEKIGQAVTGNNQEG